jgi:hypothetical protein
MDIYIYITIFEFSVPKAYHQHLAGFQLITLKNIHSIIWLRVKARRGERRGYGKVDPNPLLGLQ